MGLCSDTQNENCKVMRENLATAKPFKSCLHQCVALCNAPKCSTVLGPKYCCAFLRKRGQACDIVIIFVLGEGRVLKEYLVARWKMPFRRSHTLLCRAAAVLAVFCLIRRAASVVLFYEWDPCSVCCCLKSEMFCAG